MSNARERTVSSPDGTTIAYDIRGSGPPLVLVEPAGHFRSLSAFGGLAERLSDHYAVHQYDRRGRGASGDTPPYAVEREVEDLAAVIGASGGGPALVYGFSSGALLALHAAAAGSGVRALAVLEPPLQEHSTEDDSAFTTTLASLVAAGRNEDAVEYFHTSIGVPDEVIAEMRGTRSWTAMTEFAPSLVYDGRLGDESSFAMLDRIDVPALVLVSEGSDDDLTGWAAGVARALPHGMHRSLPGGWHGVDEAALADTLDGFFRSC